jgi:Peptidase family C25
MLRSLLISLLTMLPLAAAERGVWLCIGPEHLLAEAGPLAELRAAQGWEVRRSSAPVADALAAETVKPAAILLLGDDSTAANASPSPWLLAAARHRYHGWLEKHPAEFVSDASRGDFDADGVPDVPVGRIPGRTALEIAGVVKKILAWEARRPDPADLAIPVWAGDPGFGKIGDVLKLGWLPYYLRQIREGAPDWAGFWFLQSDLRSPFCGWPQDSAATFNRRLGGGGLFSAMIGHGRVDSWWIMNVDGGSLRYRSDHARLLSAAAPAAPHLVFACRCGAFADPAIRCLAEEFLFAPGGPVACIAASVDSHPLTNYYGSTTLLRDLAGSPGDTFGRLWVDSIRRAHTTREPLKELLVGLLEPLVIGTRNPVKDLKADHLLIYNLLGDPATRLFLPRPLEAEVVRRGDAWEWSVPKPAALPPGTRLLVQHRGPIPTFNRSPELDGREQAQASLRKANAALDFRTLHDLGPDEAWNGSIEGPGTLRLCLVGGEVLRVKAEVLGK